MAASVIAYPIGEQRRAGALLERLDGWARDSIGVSGARDEHGIEITFPDSDAVQAVAHVETVLDGFDPAWRDCVKLEPAQLS